MLCKCAVGVGAGYYFDTATLLPANNNNAFFALKLATDSYLGCQPANVAYDANSIIILDGTPSNDQRYPLTRFYAAVPFSGYHVETRPMWSGIGQNGGKLDLPILQNTGAPAEWARQQLGWATTMWRIGPTGETVVLEGKERGVYTLTNLARSMCGLDALLNVDSTGTRVGFFPNAADVNAKWVLMTEGGWVGGSVTEWKQGVHTKVVSLMQLRAGVGTRYLARDAAWSDVPTLRDSVNSCVLVGLQTGYPVGSAGENRATTSFPEPAWATPPPTAHKFTSPEQGGTGWALAAITNNFQSDRGCPVWTGYTPNVTNFFGPIFPSCAFACQQAVAHAASGGVGPTDVWCRSNTMNTSDGNARMKCVEPGRVTICANGLASCAPEQQVTIGGAGPPQAIIDNSNTPFTAYADVFAQSADYVWAPEAVTTGAFLNGAYWAAVGWLAFHRALAAAASATVVVGVTPDPLTGQPFAPLRPLAGGATRCPIGYTTSKTGETLRLWMQGGVVIANTPQSSAVSNSLSKEALSSLWLGSGGTGSGVGIMWPAITAVALLPVVAGPAGETTCPVADFWTSGPNASVTRGFAAALCENVFGYPGVEGGPAARKAVKDKGVGDVTAYSNTLNAAASAACASGPLRATETCRCINRAEPGMPWTAEFSRISGLLKNVDAVSDGQFWRWCRAFSVTETSGGGVLSLVNSAPTAWEKPISVLCTTIVNVENASEVDVDIGLIKQVVNCSATTAPAGGSSGGTGGSSGGTGGSSGGTGGGSSSSSGSSGSDATGSGNSGTGSSGETDGSASSGPDLTLIAIIVGVVILLAVILGVIVLWWKTGSLGGVGRSETPGGAVFTVET